MGGHAKTSEHGAAARRIFGLVEQRKHAHEYQKEDDAPGTMARTIEPAAKLLIISAAFGRIGMYGLPTQSLTRPPRSSGDEASSADARGHVVISLRG